MLSLAPITPTAVDIVIIQLIHPIMVALAMAIEEDMVVVTEVDMADIMAGSVAGLGAVMVVLVATADIDKAR